MVCDLRDISARVPPEPDDGHQRNQREGGDQPAETRKPPGDLRDYGDENAGQGCLEEEVCHLVTPPERAQGSLMFAGVWVHPNG